MKKRNVFGMGIMAFGLALSLGACVPKANTKQTSGSEKVFIMGSEQFPKTIDPANEWDGWFTVRYGIGETLFRLNDKLIPEPWLAKSYERLDENRWKITLNEGVKFSNGKEVTAEDVEKNLKRLASQNPRAEFLQDAQYAVEGMDLIVTTKTPQTSFIHELTDPYTSIIDTNSLDAVNTAPVGTGPYVSAEYIPDKEIHLLPNTHYWKNAPKLDQVIVKKILDKETGAIALKSGELDAFVELNPQSYEELKGNADFVAMSIPTSRVYSAYYNLETLDNAMLREAIHLAIDKVSIGEYVLKRSMEPTESPFLAETDYGTGKLQVHGFNLDLAKEKLKEANITDSDGNGFVEIDGEERELEIAYYPRLSNEQIATQIQASLTAIGIRSKIVKYENTEYLKEGKFDIGLYTLVTTPIGDPQQYLENTLGENGVTNFNHIYMEEAEPILKAFQSETDTAKRAEYAISLSQMIYDEHLIEYIGFNRLNVVTTKKVSGYWPHPTDYYQITADLDKAE